jgi:hypothetical protein
LPDGAQHGVPTNVRKLKWLNLIRLSLFSIKNSRLQHIFNEEIADLQKAFSDLEKTESVSHFKYEVMLAFWFAIHL